MCIYYNGEILTMAGKNPEYVEAVLVNYGIIEAIGDVNTLMEIYKEANCYDLKGNTLLPAFIDSHSHLTSFAMSLIEIDVSSCNLKSEVLEIIRENIYEKKSATGNLMLFNGYDESKLDEEITRDDIDMISTEYIVVIKHSSGHMGIFNSKAFDYLSIKNDSSDAFSNCINYDSGLIIENGFFFYIKLLPIMDKDNVESAYKNAISLYKSYGIGVLSEGMMVSEMIPLYKMLMKDDNIPDIVAYMDYNDSAELMEEFKTSIGCYNRHLKINGIKIVIDGSPQAKTAWLSKPYINDSNNNGYPSLSKNDVICAFKYSVENKLQIIAHCNGDAAIDLFLQSAEEVSQKNDIRKLRPVIIHAQLITEEQIRKSSKLGVILSFFPGHIYYWGDIHLKQLGIKRAGNISPLGTALKENVVYSLHQDSPVTRPDMLKSVSAVVNRKTKAGIQLNIEQCINVYDALRGITINAAYQIMEEKQRGSIEVGKRGEFVILKNNPLKVNKEAIQDISIVDCIM